MSEDVLDFTRLYTADLVGIDASGEKDVDPELNLSDDDAWGDTEA